MLSYLIHDPDPACIPVQSRPAPNDHPAFPEATPPHGDLASGNVTRRILGIVVFNFIAYLSVGLPIAVVPGFVHGDLGYSAVLAGLAVSIQYLATLLSRPWAGSLCDMKGPKRSVLTGLLLCAGSGLLMLAPRSSRATTGSRWAGCCRAA
jgi:hypothetical protein